MYKVPKKVLATLTQIKTFGTFGEKYKIIGVIKPASCRDWLMKIKVLSTGEIINYRYSQIVYDPMADV